MVRVVKIEIAEEAETLKKLLVSNFARLTPPTFRTATQADAEAVAHVYLASRNEENCPDVLYEWHRFKHYLLQKCDCFTADRI